MDLGNPIHSVIPSSHGEVLSVLARTEQPLTGRGVAELTNGRVSQKGTNLALRTLAAAGVVTVEDHPPAKLYTLNRRHLAALPIEALASLRDQLIEAMRVQLTGWSSPAWGAWLFGSAARGDGDESSDVDVVLVRPDTTPDSEVGWLEQVEHFIDAVAGWTGNRCEVIEYSLSEFEQLFERDDRLARDLRSDGIALTDRRLPRRTSAKRTDR